MRYKKHWGRSGYHYIGNLPVWKGECGDKMFSYDPRNLPVCSCPYILDITVSWSDEDIHHAITYWEMTLEREHL